MFEAYLKNATQRAVSLEKYAPYGIQRRLDHYYYISHYYPLKAMNDVSPKDAADLIEALSDQRFETYIHYPYCEQICTFCHFYKELNTGEYHKKEKDMLDLIERELKNYPNILDGPIKARSLQIGGGTPSLISNKNLEKFLAVVRNSMDIEEGAEIKTEIYPKNYDGGELEEKLRILRGFGVTDLVIDIESGNRQTLDFINRKNSSLEDYLRLVEKSITAGFTSIVTALIVGLPYETPETLIRTIDALISIPEVKVINTFPLVMREFDPIAKQISRKPESGVTSKGRDILWLMARDYLRERGYVEGPISYFHPRSKRPEQQADKFECVNLLGIGPSAFGYLNGGDWAAQYYNHCDFHDYAASVTAGELPMWRAGRADNAERARRKIIFGLANVKTESLVDIEDVYGVSVDQICGRELNALEALGLIEIDKAGQGIRYTEDGLSRLEEITYFLGSEFVKDRTDWAPGPRDSRHPNLLRNHHYTVTMPAEDRTRFEAFRDKHPSSFMSRLN